MECPSTPIRPITRKSLRQHDLNRKKLRSMEKNNGPRVTELQGIELFEPGEVSYTSDENDPHN